MLKTKKNVTSDPNAAPLEAFADSFQKLFKPCNRCGNYFEEK
jgi:hypothetical protein